MDAGLISLIVNILLAAALVYGFLWGIGRGVKNSAIRLGYFALFVLIFAFVSPLISQALVGIKFSFLNGSLADYITNGISANPNLSDMYANNEAFRQLVAKLPVLIMNLVVFILLVLLAKFFSWIAYKITIKIMAKKKMAKIVEQPKFRVVNGKPVPVAQIPENADTSKKSKKKKYKEHKSAGNRLLGGVIGAVWGFLIMFALFIPISGTVHTVSSYIDFKDNASAEVVLAEDNAKTDDFEYEQFSNFVKDLLGEDTLQYIEAFNNSIYAKVTYVGGVDLVFYDVISSVRVDGTKISLRNEFNTVVDVAEGVLYIQSVLEDEEFNLQNLDTKKLEKAVDSVFNSGIISTVGESFITYYMDKIMNCGLIMSDERLGQINNRLDEIYDILGNNLNDTNKTALEQEMLKLHKERSSAYDKQKLQDRLSGIESELTTVGISSQTQNKLNFEKQQINLLLQDTIEESIAIIIDENTRQMALDFAKEIDESLKKAESYIEQFKSDFQALLGVFDAVKSSGLLDYLVKGEDYVVPGQYLKKGTTEVDQIKLIRSFLDGTNPASVRGTNETSHDYLKDMLDSVLSSTTLRATLVGGVNAGIDVLTTTLKDEITEDLKEQDKTENEIKTEFSTKPVTISKVSQTSIDWDAISTNIRTIINKGFEIYDFLDENKVFEIANDTQTFAESEENKILKQINTMLNDDDFNKVYYNIAEILDTILNSQFIINTVDSKNILQQVITELGRIKSIDNYIDCDTLKGKIWTANSNTTKFFKNIFEKELNIINFVKPILISVEKGELDEFAFKNLDYSKLRTYIAGEFDNPFVQAFRTSELKAEIANSDDTQMVQDIINALFKNKNYLSDFEDFALNYTDMLIEFGKAGIFELVFFAINESDETSQNPTFVIPFGDNTQQITIEEKLNEFLENFIKTDTTQTTSYLENIIKDFFKSDEIRNCIVILFNDTKNGLLARIGSDNSLGEMSTTEDWTKSIEDISDCLTKFIEIYLDLKITDFSQFTDSEDTMSAIFDIILTDKFVSTDGNAEKLGIILDKLCALDIFNYTDNTDNQETKNIIKNIITEKMDGFDLFDVSGLKTDTTGNFFQNELKVLATALVILNDKVYTYNGGEESMLKGLLSGNVDFIVASEEFEKFKDEDTENFDKLIDAFASSKLIKKISEPFFINIANHLVKAIDKSIIVADTETIKDLSVQKAELKAVVKGVIALININASSFSDLMASSDNRAVVQTILVALQNNAYNTTYNNGIYFDYYNEIFDYLQNTNTDTKEVFKNDFASATAKTIDWSEFFDRITKLEG